MPLAIPLPRNFLPRFPLRYMGRDPESLCERVDGTTIVKALRIDGQPSLLQLDLLPREARLRVTPARRTRAARDAATSIALRLLGLPFDPAPFERRIARDPRLAPLVAGRRGLRIPLTANVFEAVVWAIVGQQVNLAFAYKLRRVVVELAGERIGSLIAHPDPAAVARLDYDDLTRRQFSRRKAEYLIDTARLIADGALDVESMPAQDPAAVQTTLMAVRGFGAWSTNYVMLRGCGFADCVPLGDTGLTSGLQSFFGLDRRPDADETLRRLAPFAPFRSLATFHLWMRDA